LQQAVEMYTDRVNVHGPAMPQFSSSRQCALAKAPQANHWLHWTRHSQHQQMSYSHH